MNELLTSLPISFPTRFQKGYNFFVFLKILLTQVVARDWRMYFFKSCRLFSSAAQQVLVQIPTDERVSLFQKKSHFVLLIFWLLWKQFQQHCWFFFDQNSKNSRPDSKTNFQKVFSLQTTVFLQIFFSTSKVQS